MSNGGKEVNIARRVISMFYWGIAAMIRRIRVIRVLSRHTF
jgi:hypothetical protein